MTAICFPFDTIGFLKKLEAVGVEPKVAEVFAGFQAELQTKVLEKFEEYRPILDEIKIKKDEFATKSDIAELKHEIDNVRHDINNVRGELKADMTALDYKMDTLHNKLIIKLGSIMVGVSAVLGVILSLLHHG